MGFFLRKLRPPEHLFNPGLVGVDSGAGGGDDVDFRWDPLRSRSAGMWAEADLIEPEVEEEFFDRKYDLRGEVATELLVLSLGEQYIFTANMLLC